MVGTERKKHRIGLWFVVFGALLLALFLPRARSLAQPSDADLQLHAFAYAKVDGAITDLASTGLVGDGRLFVTTKDGAIWIVRQAGEVADTPFLDLRGVVVTLGESGLVGLAFDPDYGNNGRFYVTYVRDEEEGGETITRLHLSRFEVSVADNNVADAGSEVVLLSVKQPGYLHNGGDLAFGPDDGFLYLGLGDGRSSGRHEQYDAAQDLSMLLGKILRIDVSGDGAYAIPPDNPFVGQADAREEIWAVGLRNPWRISFDTHSGDLYMGDVGQNAWEEVNVMRPEGGGANFGWPCMEGLSVYEAGMCAPGVVLTLPVYAYSQYEGTGCSITGGIVYRGQAYEQRLSGKYIFSDFCDPSLRVMDPALDYQVQVLATPAGLRVTTFGIDNEGELYSGGLDGVVRRLREIGDWERVAMPLLTGLQ
ncbi:MAG: PQQ-dependent sugar dehydrogenase [Candidatus Promineifilaceae bacterium]|nr:PQQ-dependent sugar dehydrogenase [Candidatus Promineifilaceae bacterium]